MSSDTKAIIGTVVGCTLAHGVLMTTIRIDDLGTRIDRLEMRLDERLDGLDERLRAVEVELGKVDQRLETLERLHLPTPAGNE